MDPAMKPEKPIMLRNNVYRRPRGEAVLSVLGAQRWNERLNTENKHQINYWDRSEQIRDHGWEKFSQYDANKQAFNEMQSRPSSVPYRKTLLSMQTNKAPLYRTAMTARRHADVLPVLSKYNDLYTPRKYVKFPDHPAGIYDHKDDVSKFEGRKMSEFTKWKESLLRSKTNI